MTERIRKSGHWLLCAIVVLGATLCGLSSSLAQNGAPMPSMPALLIAALQSEPARTVLLPDGRLLTLHDSELVLASTSAVTHRTSTQHVLLPWVQQFASVTVVPDGRVLIWGGVDEQGHTIARGMWFDPATGDLTQAVNLPLAARAGGTATVLSDGRLLFMGGWSSQVGVTPQPELWDARKDDLTSVASALPARLGQTATLLPDGRVQLSGGFDQDGKPATVTAVFDPAMQQFAAADAKSLIVPVNGMSQPKLMASLPPANATDFAADGILSLRFSEPMDPRTINGKTITLLGPGGDVSATVFAVEGGRLAFITPKRDLYPSAHYTLFAQGVSSQRLAALPFTAIDFAVAAQNAAGNATNASSQSGNNSAAAAGSTRIPASSPSILPPLYAMTGTGTTSTQSVGPCGVTGHPVNALCRETSFMDTVNDAWYPGQDKAGHPTSGDWRVKKSDITPQEIAYAELMLRVPDSGATGISGRIELIDDKPIGNADVSIGNQHTRTDSNGRFKLTGVPAGHQWLYVDGTTANSPSHQYGQFVVGVNLKAGVVLPLTYRMYLPRILPRDVINIPSPTTRDMVITQPDIPGLEVHVPAGTVIKDYKGHVVTQLAIVPTPVNRAPFPTTVNFPVFFSIQPSGATVTNINPKGVQGISLVYPNYGHIAPGTKTDFVVYHPDTNWRVYGTGIVTPDGRQVVPVTGGRMVWLFSGMFALPGTRPGDQPQGKENGPCCGDPVDLFSGTLEESVTDIAIRDIMPITLTRYFHSMSQSSASWGHTNMFGGWRSNYDIALYNDGSGDVVLVLPDGNGMPFEPVATLPNEYGTWQAPPSPTKWSGALMEAVEGSNFARCEGASADGECVVITLKDGTQYIFSDGDDGNNLPMFIRDRFGNQLALTWSGGLLQQITSPSGRFISFAYNSDNTIATATDNMGRTWTYNYTTQTLGSPAVLTTYNLMSAVYPDSTSWQYTYETSQTNGNWGALLTMKDRNGNQTTNIYATMLSGGSGAYTWFAVSQQILPDGSTYKFGFSNGGWNITDPDGNVTAVTLDAASGYTEKVTRAPGTSLAETTTYNRESNGLIDSMTDALGRTTSYTYDGLGNVLSLSITGMQGTPSSVTEHFTWTPDYNQIATYQDGLGHTKTFSYTNGCLTQIKDPLGHATNIVCSITGQPLTITDALNHTTTFGYQAYDLRRVTDALNRTTTLTTDPLGRLVAVADPSGDVSRRVYDPADDRVDSMVDPMGNTTAIQYDGMDDVKQVTLPGAGGSISYLYDTRNRLKQRTDALHQSESWTYYPLGEIKTHTDRKGQTTSYTYDALDRLNQTTYTDGANVIATYDAGNRLTELNDTAGGIAQFGWNGLDELTEEQTEPLGAKQFQTVRYQYDAAGRRQWMLAGSQAQVNYTYDTANRLTKLAQGSAAVTPVFDNANRLTKLTLPNGVAQSYGYDNVNEVTGITYAKGSTTLGNLAYTYDAAGRRTGQTGTFASDTLPTATTANGTFDANNRQTKFNGATLQYDANGNLTFDGTNTYVWNARNQLVQIKQGASVIASFTYDPLGRRQSRTTDGVTTSYLYDGLNPVQEAQGTTVSSILEGLGVDHYFARQEPANGNAEEYFLTDALGSTVALTSSSGAILQQYHYGPYGEANANNPGITNPYQYTGRENDGDGLYYYRARYYSPMMKRFIGEDPIRFMGGQNNFYAYVGDNSVSYVDPLGLWPSVDPWAALGEMGTTLDEAAQFGASRLGAVGLAWTVGYGVGTLINDYAITPGLTYMNGYPTDLGTEIYNLTHPEVPNPLPQTPQPQNPQSQDQKNKCNNG